MKTQRLCRLLVSPNMPTAVGNFKNKKGRRNTISATSLSFVILLIQFLKKNVNKNLIIFFRFEIEKYYRLPRRFAPRNDIVDCHIASLLAITRNSSMSLRAEGEAIH